MKTELEAHDIQNVLSPHTLEKIQKGEDNYNFERATQFIAFKKRVDTELLNHPIITRNEYTKWFSKGEMNAAQVKDFLVQFSVFSNLFLIAQLKKVINADSLESMRASKEILANELGVIFNKGKKETTTDPSADNMVSSHGTVEGGMFRFKAAHFEWLFEIAKDFGLSWNEIGKRSVGTTSTLFFCDELSRLYGSEHYTISQAASFAVENWAASSGFWKELIQGLKTFKEKEKKNFSVSFFIHHDLLEQQHADHTQEELEEYYFENPNLKEDDYIRYNQEMLAAVEVFWKGLNEARKTLA
ncbi:MAG: hypothetical protein R3A11_06045 [Bdellovibrionota bacterium]